MTDAGSLHAGPHSAHECDHGYANDQETFRCAVLASAFAAVNPEKYQRRDNEDDEPRQQTLAQLSVFFDEGGLADTFFDRLPRRCRNRYESQTDQADR